LGFGSDLSADAIVKLIVVANAVAFSIALTAELDAIHAIVDAGVVALGSNIYITAARQRSTINLRAALGFGSDLSADTIVELIVVANAVALSVAFTAELHTTHAIVDARIIALGSDVLITAARQRSTINLRAALGFGSDLSAYTIVELIIIANTVAFSIAFTAELHTTHAIVDAGIIALGSNILITAARQRSTINLRTALGFGSDLSADTIVKLIVVANAVAFSVAFTAELDVIHTVVNARIIALGSNILITAAR